jgi:ATP/maltotriose-dependent transcriptional regulator MalT
MAVLAMRAGGDPDEVIDALASTTQEASDYLASEVMNRLPADLAGALASLAQARLALTAPDNKVRAQFAIEEFRLALALAPTEASALIPQLPDNTASRLLQARLHVLRQEWTKAEQILHEVKPGTIRERVEWGVLRSLAAQAADLAQAHCHLRTALALTSPHRYLATIIDQGPGIAALLRSIPVSAGLKPYVDELSVRAEGAAASSGGQAGLLPGGLLSDRELAVLRLLASRLTTTEIAGVLFVSQHPQVAHQEHLPQARRQLQGGRSPRR